MPKFVYATTTTTTTTSSTRTFCWKASLPSTTALYGCKKKKKKSFSIEAQPGTSPVIIPSPTSALSDPVEEVLEFYRFIELYRVFKKFFITTCICRVTLKMPQCFNHFQQHRGIYWDKV